MEGLIQSSSANFSRTSVDAGRETKKSDPLPLKHKCYKPLITVFTSSYHHIPKPCWEATHTLNSPCVPSLLIYKLGLQPFGTVDILGWIIPGRGGCPVGIPKVFSRVPGSLPTSGSISLLHWDNPMSSIGSLGAKSNAGPTVQKLGTQPPFSIRFCSNSDHEKKAATTELLGRIFCAICAGERLETLSLLSLVSRPADDQMQTSLERWTP